MKPNLIERLEELAYALESAALHIAVAGRINSGEYTDVDNAYGIAGEILTMVDGR